MGKKIAEKAVKTKSVHDVDSRNVEEIFISPEERKILNELRHVIKWSTTNI